MFDIKKEVAALENELITLRRDFHAHPELGYQEFLTSKKICGYLTALGLEDIQTITKTGVTAILRVQGRRKDHYAKSRYGCSAC